MKTYILDVGQGSKYVSAYGESSSADQACTKTFESSKLLCRRLVTRSEPFWKNRFFFIQNKTANNCNCCHRSGTSTSKFTGDKSCFHTHFIGCKLNFSFLIQFLAVSQKLFLVINLKTYKWLFSSSTRSLRKYLGRYSCNFTKKSYVP